MNLKQLVVLVALTVAILVPSQAMGHEMLEDFEYLMQQLIEDTFEDLDVVVVTESRDHQGRHPVLGAILEDEAIVHIVGRGFKVRQQKFDDMMDDYQKGKDVPTHYLSIVLLDEGETLEIRVSFSHPSRGSIHSMKRVSVEMTPVMRELFYSSVSK